MAQTRDYLAFDIGAESGRAMIGHFDGNSLSITEIHRFANIPVYLPDGLHWDVLRLWSDIKDGLAKAAKLDRSNLAALGIDTWGVDFALLDRDDLLIGNPYHYRDSRTDGMLDLALERVPRQSIFAQTGIQFLSINTVYQLLALVQQKATSLDIAQTFLTIPDLFNFWFSGQKVAEFSNATTTQCFNPVTGNWATNLLNSLEIPERIFPNIIKPGTVLDDLLPAVAEETGAPRLPVIAPACHDTGSAVVAVPAQGSKAGQPPDFAWISSGTWSIMGVEVAEAVLNEQALAFNLTNEGGVADTFRLSKNVMGLWLVQECRRHWLREGSDYSYEALTRMAAATPSLQSIIDPDYADFVKPGDMPSRILAYCQQTRQSVPDTEGAIIRCILESLALKYRWVLDKLEILLGYRLNTIHIVGGGTQNQLLNQFTADATSRPVITGPAEATATGNIIMQMLALGHINSVAEGRDLVRRSFEVTTYEPAHSAAWDEAYNRLLPMIE